MSTEKVAHELVKLCSAGKAYVPQTVQREPRSAGADPSSPVVNQPSMAGTRVVPVRVAVIS